MRNSSQEPPNTRDQLLDAAEELFAERGFYGVSIAAVADCLGITKQALLHHFGTKERLYAEVLRRISDRFAELPGESQASPADALRSYFLRLHTQLQQNPAQTRLLMRELLDNNQRAESAGKWYLEPFLNRLTDMVLAQPNWQQATREAALAFAYLLVGAINYYGVSGPTLAGMFGKRKQAQLDKTMPDQLAALLDAALNSQPGLSRASPTIP